MVMTDTVFRPSGSSGVDTISNPNPVAPPDDKWHAEIEATEDIMPLELDNRKSGTLTLEVLGLDEDISDLPSEDQTQLKDIEDYVKQIMNKKGLEPTKGVFARTFENLKNDMGLDPDSSHEEIIRRIGGVISSYRDLGFIKDAGERRSLFMKLARQNSVEDMNQIVYETMTKHKIWQT